MSRGPGRESSHPVDVAHDHRRGAAPLAWSLLGLVLAGVVLFGAVQDLYAHALAGLVMILAAVLLHRVRDEDAPDHAGIVVTLLFPAWIVLQLLPFPRGLVTLLSPRAAQWSASFWSGPLHGCGGEELLGSAPSLLPLSVDPTSTRVFLFRAFGVLLLFLAARAYFRRDDARGDAQRLALLAVVSCFTALQAAYGIVETLSDVPSVLWVTKVAHIESASGTLMNRNHFALLLNLGLGSTLTLLLWRLEQHRVKDRGRESALRVTLAVLAALQFAGLLASRSRAGIACSAIVLAAAAPLLRRGDRWFRVAAAGIIALVTLPALALFGPALLGRLAELPAEWTATGGRGQVFRLGLGMVRDFPLAGTGAGTFEFAFPPYRTPGISGLYNFAHNDYLQILVETGLVGLCLALAPVALFAAALRRHLRDEDRPFTPWPLLGAFAAVAVHELVDFGLQMPALSFLFALLAGAFYPVGAATQRAKRAWRLALTAIAMAFAVPAVAHSAASWPVVGRFVPWPDLPDQLASRAEGLLGRMGGGNAGPLCEAMIVQARAQKLRPLGGGLSIKYAQYGLRALEAGSLPEERRDQIRSEASRLAEKIRVLDPNNPWDRQRTMNISLALGELDKAVNDASLVIRENAGLAGATVHQLLDVGLPAELIHRIVPRDPVVLRVVLEPLVKSKDWAAVARIVPMDQPPDPALCLNPWLLHAALTSAHRAPAASTLEGCLALPEIRSNASAGRQIRRLLVDIALAANDLPGADHWLGQIDAGTADRLWAELAVGEGAGRPDLAIGAGIALLDRNQALEAAPRAWLHFRLGRAYAKKNDLARAIEELERASELDPTLQLAVPLRSLRNGTNPF